jgi:menaquinone-dependent protoporphyrinogen oxidase
MSTLIIYASKYGCSEKCALSLSEKLTGEVDLVNLQLDKVPELAKYDKVVIGGSIYIGQIQKSIKELCVKNLELLSKKKLGLFICCMFTGEKAETQMQNAFPKELTDYAAAKGFFGGEIIISKLSFVDKLMTKMVAKASKPEEGIPVMDPKMGLSAISKDNIDRFCKVINTL